MSSAATGVDTTNRTQRVSISGGMDLDGATDDSGSNRGAHVGSSSASSSSSGAGNCAGPRADHIEALHVGNLVTKRFVEPLGLCHGIVESIDASNANISTTTTVVIRYTDGLMAGRSECLPYGRAVKVNYCFFY